MSATRSRFAGFVLGLIVVVLGAGLACSKKLNVSVVGPAFCTLPGRQTNTYVQVDFSQPSGVLTPYIIVCAGDTVTWKITPGTNFSVSVPPDSGDTPLNMTSFNNANPTGTVQPQGDLTNPGDSHFFAYSVTQPQPSAGGGGTPQDPGIIIMK